LLHDDNEAVPVTVPPFCFPAWHFFADTLSFTPFLAGRGHLQ